MSTSSRLGLSLLGLFLSGCTGMHYPGYGPGGMGFAPGGGFMWLIWLALAAVIIYLIVRAARGGTSAGGSDDTPRRILDERYARGEITKEEYQDMKRELES